MTTSIPINYNLSLACIEEVEKWDKRILDLVRDMTSFMNEADSKKLLTSRDKGYP